MARSPSRSAGRSEINARLSPSEARVLALLPKSGRRVDTGYLSDKFYAGKVPFNGRIVVASLVRNLSRKLSFVRRSKRRGPYPIEVWRND